MLYSLARFFLEYLRGDYNNLILGLKSAQWTSSVSYTHLDVYKRQVPAYSQKAFGGLSQNHSIRTLDRSSHLWKSSHRLAEQKYTYLLFLLTDLQ